MNHRQLLTVYRSACLLGVLLVALGCEQASDPANHTQPQPTKVAQPAVKEEPDSELLSETWEAMFMQGAKIGYGRTTRRKVTTAQGTRIVTESEQVPLINRYRQATQQTLSFRTEAAEDGKLHSLDAELHAGAMDYRTHGEWKDGVLSLTTFTKGKRSTTSMPWSDDLQGYFGLEESLRRKPMQPGETRHIQWFPAILHQVSDDTLTAIDFEDVDLIGERKRLLRIEALQKLGKQSVKRVIWVDELGEPWRVSEPATNQEVFRTSEEVAKRPSEKSFDLGLSTIVKVERPLERPHDTRRVVYRARLKHGNPAEVFPGCGSQTVKSLDEHTAEITVLRVTASEPKVIELPCPAPAAGDRSPNSLIQSDDPAVLKIAQEVATAEKDPEKIALALEQAVKQRVKNKNFSQAFSTAADVAATLEGDCTEHAVLLAALCRARKIPARVAAGLVYYAPEQGFAYHMWTEAWLAGRWVPLDATLGRGGIGGGHLKLFDSDLDGVGAFGAFLPVMNVLGQLELEIVEVDYN